MPCRSTFAFCLERPLAGLSSITLLGRVLTDVKSLPCSRYRNSVVRLSRDALEAYLDCSGLFRVGFH